jgi:hypothetical protein
MITPSEWISTGKAAALLGYCPDHFRAKFFDAFHAEGTVMRLPSGHCRWKREAVARLAGSATAPWWGPELPPELEALLNPTDPKEKPKG